MLCVEVCPAQAFTGRSFDLNEPRDMRMDPGACDKHRETQKRETGVRVCGLCVTICPHGRQTSPDSSGEH